LTRTALVYPMFALVLLTFSVLVALFRARTRFVRQGAVDAAFFKTYQDGREPESSAQLARHFANLFEAPVLFYAVCLAAMVIGRSSAWMIGLAWLYVGLRVAHAWIHTGRNQLKHRIAAYFSSWAVLLLMWATLVLSVASGAG